MPNPPVGFSIDLLFLISKPIKIGEIIKGNNLEEKVPFTFDCFCSTSILENTHCLRVLGTAFEKLCSFQVSPQRATGQLKDARRTPAFSFCGSFLIFGFFLCRRSAPAKPGPSAVSWFPLALTVATLAGRRDDGPLANWEQWPQSSVHTDRCGQSLFLHEALPPRWTVILNSVAPAVLPRLAGAAGGRVRGQSLPGFGSWGRKVTDCRAADGLACLAEGRLNAQRASRSQPFPQKRKFSICKKCILTADHLVLSFC